MEKKWRKESKCSYAERPEREGGRERKRGE